MTTPAIITSDTMPSSGSDTHTVSRIEVKVVLACVERSMSTATVSMLAMMTTPTRTVITIATIPPIRD